MNDNHGNYSFTNTYGCLENLPLTYDLQERMNTGCQHNMEILFHSKLLNPFVHFMGSTVHVISFLLTHGLLYDSVKKFLFFQLGLPKKCPAIGHDDKVGNRKSGVSNNRDLCVGGFFSALRYKLSQRKSMKTIY